MDQLDELIRTRSALDDALRSEKGRVVALETELAAKNSEASLNKRTLKHIADTMLAFQSRQSQHEEALQTLATARLQLCNRRIATLRESVRHTALVQHAASVSDKTTRELLERKLQEVQSSLKAALLSNEVGAETHEKLWTDLQESQRKQEQLERSLQDAIYEAEEESRAAQNALNVHNAQNTSSEGLFISAEEFARLAARLENAELRAEEMATNGAKAFARSARTVAFLEGECSRLRTLGDHFRAVNMKLMGDVKAAHEEVRWRCGKCITTDT